jgi:molybdopterin/thiamine biosynthesis adenylyltransferase
LRESLIVQREDDELLFLFSASRLVKRFVVDDLVIRALPKLDGTNTVADLVDALGGDPASTIEDLHVMLGVLEDENILSKVSDHNAVAAGTLGTSRAEFYDRQVRILQDFCDEGLGESTEGAVLQQRIGQATAVVCGLGGTGSWVAHSLAAAGVGTLRLCDFDRVEPSNLTRQVLFSMSDIGRLKTEAAADRIGAINPYVRVQAFNREIQCSGDLADLVVGADVVINAADQPSPNSISAWVAQGCWPTAVPHIMGSGYSYNMGILGTTILPGETACWECVRAETFTDHGRDRSTTFIGRRERGGALGPLSGLVGNILAWEGIRVIAGLPAGLAGQWAELDYWPLQVRTRDIPRRPHCPNCGEDSS